MEKTFEKRIILTGNNRTNLLFEQTHLLNGNGFCDLLVTGFGKYAKLEVKETFFKSPVVTHVKNIFEKTQIPYYLKCFKQDPNSEIWCIVKNDNRYIIFKISLSFCKTISSITFSTLFLCTTQYLVSENLLDCLLFLERYFNE